MSVWLRVFSSRQRDDSDHPSCDCQRTGVTRAEVQRCRGASSTLPTDGLSLQSATHHTHHITSHHITSHHITSHSSHHFTPHTSHHITPHHTTSHHITSHHTHHITSHSSHHITSHHITSHSSHHITSHHVRTNTKLTTVTLDSVYSDATQLNSTSS